MNDLLIAEIFVLILSVGVIIHALLELWRPDEHDHEFDFTPFGKPKK